MTMTRRTAVLREMARILDSRPTLTHDIDVYRTVRREAVANIRSRDFAWHMTF